MVFATKQVRNYINNVRAVFNPFVAISLGFIKKLSKENFVFTTILKDYNVEILKQKIIRMFLAVFVKKSFSKVFRINLFTPYI